VSENMVLSIQAKYRHSKGPSRTTPFRWDQAISTPQFRVTPKTKHTKHLSFMPSNNCQHETNLYNWI